MVFIAEIGLNHNGNFNLCYEMIKQAKNSGADIVKFQLGWRSAKHEINYKVSTIIGPADRFIFIKYTQLNNFLNNKFYIVHGLFFYYLATVA